jgi:hypothetical protein
MLLLFLPILHGARSTPVRWFPYKISMLRVLGLTLPVTNIRKNWKECFRYVNNLYVELDKLPECCVYRINKYIYIE